MRTLAGRLVGLQRGAAFNVLSDVTWRAIYWANNPSWSHPADGADVGQWDDGSSNAWHATEATTKPVMRTTGGPNSTKCVEFVAANTDKLNASGWTSLAQPATVLVVARTTTTTSQQCVSVFGGAVFCNLRSSSLAFHQMNGGTPLVDAHATDTNWHAVRFYANGGSSTIQTDNEAATNGNAGANALGAGIYLGTNGSTNYADLKIALVAAYAGDLTAHAKWSALKSWITSYYGIAMP